MRSRPLSPQGFHHWSSSTTSISEHIDDLENLNLRTPILSDDHGGLSVGGIQSPLILHKYPPGSVRQAINNHHVNQPATAPGQNTCSEAKGQQIDSQRKEGASVTSARGIDISPEAASHIIPLESPKASVYHGLGESLTTFDTQQSQKDIVTDDGSLAEPPSLMHEIFRTHRRHRSTLSYHILLCREQLSSVRRERSHLTNLMLRLLSQLDNGTSQPYDSSSNKIWTLSQDIAKAISDVNITETQLESIEYDVNVADAELKSSEDQLKDLIAPDDSTDYPDILERTFEALSLPAEHTSIHSEGTASNMTLVEVQLSPLQQDFLQEALYSSITAPLGIVDLNAFLAHEPISASGSSQYANSESAETEQDALNLQKALEMELEVRLSGIQFQTPSRTTPDKSFSAGNDLLPDDMQIEKRQVDLEQRERTSFYEDFWHIYRTSWLEFSRFLRHIECLAERYRERFGLLGQLSPMEIDQLLERVEDEDHAQRPRKAVKRISRPVALRTKLPMAAIERPRSHRSLMVFPAYASVPDPMRQTKTNEVGKAKRDLITTIVIPDLPARPKAKSLPYQHLDSIISQPVHDELLFDEKEVARDEKWHALHYEHVALIRQDKVSGACSSSRQTQGNQSSHSFFQRSLD